MRYIITQKEAKTRIDIFLSETLGISRSRTQRYITDGTILVNDSPSKKNYVLKDGDIITSTEEINTDTEITTSVLPNSAVTLPVIFEDEHILIINKPAGMLVHPTLRYEIDTVVNGLMAIHPEIKGVGEDPLRPGIVHRLDKMVSGLLLITKTQEAFEYFKKQFKGRTMYKEYTALVHGVMEHPHGIIDLTLERDKKIGRMVARPVSQKKGKSAITEYDVLKNFTHFSLVKIVIKTGRTHQIRAHFHALNHPLIGDPLYAQKKVKQTMVLNRIFLHSTRLRFKHITGEKLEFEAPLPLELRDILSTLS